jgi:hypothetical protein
MTMTEIQHVSFSDWGGVVEARLIPKDEEATCKYVRIPTKRVKHPHRKALRWLASNHPKASHSYVVERGACCPCEYN